MKGSRRVIGRLAGRLVAASVVVALGAFAFAHGDGEAALAPDAVKPLEKVAKELAKSGRTKDLDELLDVLRACGMEAAAHAKLATTCRQECGKAKKAAPSVPAVAKSLQKIASDLGARLPALGEAARGELARLMLRLDGRCEAAHQALGRRKVGEEWLDEEAKVRRGHRDGIAGAIARARSLPVAVETGKSDHLYFALSKCRTPNVARCGKVVLHGVFAPEKLERILRETMRALAVDNYLLTGDLSVPTLPGQLFLFFDEEREYFDALQIALQRKTIDEKRLEESKKMHAAYVRDDYVGFDVTEASIESSLHAHLLSNASWKGALGYTLDNTQQALVTGLTNYTSLAYLGERLPVFAVEEGGEDAAGKASPTLGLSDEQRVRRERMLLLSEAGLSGGRSWMCYLAERREDPPLASLLTDQMGRLQGNELLKATFVVELLAQHGPLLLRFRHMEDEKPGMTAEQIMEKALGEPLARFDARWREWLLPARPGLAETLSAPASAEKLAPDEQRTLAALQELRRRAHASDVVVDFDREAAAACHMHALYLAKNADQLARWPDAHEEYPDRPGFDVAGALAGGRSVIAPGVADGREALDAWMATFYHRIPLLEPQLVRIGYAFEANCAVLDCGSFVRPHDLRDLSGGSETHDPLWWGVVWPPPDATEVPTRFLPELPQPVPGEDESKMGYPITFQLAYAVEEKPRVELVLHAGGADARPVACWFSSPDAPTNPKMAPDDVWCLIPKEALVSGRYTVTGSIALAGAKPVQGTFEWSFRCGAK